MTDRHQEVAGHAKAILDYWFSTLDDGATLDRTQEPFGTCMQRWYGKEATIDAEIRTRFEPLLVEVAADGRKLEQELDAWRKTPLGLLALVLLLDQFPRNMYRGTPTMYAHDPLALAVTLAAIREYASDAELPLVKRMFLYVPLMHVENATLQRHMLSLFEGLADEAAVRCPDNRPFFDFARGYAQKHLDVVSRFGRFPHRNAILGRRSTPAEEGFLIEHPGF